MGASTRIIFEPGGVAWSPSCGIWCRHRRDGVRSSGFNRAREGWEAAANCAQLSVPAGGFFGVTRVAFDGLTDKNDDSDHGPLVPVIQNNITDGGNEAVTP